MLPAPNKKSANPVEETAHGGTARTGDCRLAATRTACYKSLMKIIERWLLFKYVDGQFTPLSKPFKTKATAEKARLKLPEREQRSVAVGVIRIEK